VSSGHRGSAPGVRPARPGELAAVEVGEDPGAEEAAVVVGAFLWTLVVVLLIVVVLGYVF
jgi:hypothetical protein